LNAVSALRTCVCDCAAIKLGKLKDEIDDISTDCQAHRLPELNQRRLIKLHERFADVAVSVECYHLALQHYQNMVCMLLSM